MIRNRKPISTVFDFGHQHGIPQSNQQIMSRRALALAELGGVEETKQEDDENGIPFSPLSVPHRQSSSLIPPDASTEKPAEAQDETLSERLHSLARAVLCSCGQALSFLGDGCRWNTERGGPVGPGRPPESVHGARPHLSITNELRELAAKEGRVFGGGMRRADIPRFLGEDAVYSFEDDNISAISQNTLEELSKHGISYPIRRKISSADSDAAAAGPPSPTRTFSASSGSDDRKTEAR